MEEKVKNRAWVKDAAIIFLAVMLVLTFFSSTIMNRSLTEAATEEVRPGAITAKVRGKGIVEANGSNKVKANSTVTIAKVMVKAGDKVKADDVLFILGAGDSDELAAAKETLEDLEMSYNQALLNMPVGENYTAEYNAIESSRKDIVEAERLMNDIANELKLTTIEDEEEIIGDALSNEELVYLVGIKDETLAAVDALRAKRDELQRTINEAEYEVDIASQRVNELTELLNNTESEEEKAQIQLELDAANIALSEKQTFKDNVEAAVRTELNSIIVEVNSNEAKLNEIIRKINSLKAPSDSPIVGKESKYTYNDYLSAKRAYEDACDSYENLTASLQYSQAMDGRSYNSAYLAVQAIQLKIDRQKEKIKELAGEDPENTIVAKTAGIVSEVNCASGDSVVKGDILAVIEVPDMGYTVSFSVTNDQARRLKIGDKATISNFYWGNEITATLKSIATDKKNPQSQKLLTFDVEGDVNSGSELTVSVGQKSASYDLVIPNSAIRNDNNGSFVYIIEAKNSPVGNRYIAKRVKVEVLASDDTNSAVTADMESGDFVITTTGAPIKNGEQVRLANAAN